jgi:acyl CoA:acetate/3-ketoacid CoA transferase alpha subunit
LFPRGTHTAVRDSDDICQKRPIKEQKRDLVRSNKGHTLQFVIAMAHVWAFECMYVCTHTHTHTQTHTNPQTHTHTHTHTQYVIVMEHMSGGELLNRLRADGMTMPAFFAPFKKKIKASP